MGIYSGDIIDGDSMALEPKDKVIEQKVTCLFCLLNFYGEMSLDYGWNWGVELKYISREIFLYMHGYD